jgi:hypothetical protein
LGWKDYYLLFNIIFQQLFQLYCDHHNYWSRKLNSYNEVIGEIARLRDNNNDKYKGLNIFKRKNVFLNMPNSLSFKAILSTTIVIFCMHKIFVVFRTDLMPYLRGKQTRHAAASGLLA